MSEVRDLPIIADLDTGFGDAVNVAYIIRRYEAAGVSAVVIEDKTFPKDSSVRTDGRQTLIPIPEFQGKIAAAKAVGSMLVIARTEALIAGLGQDEAIRRGMAYVEAGADAILIHSKQKTPDEILSFCKAWPGDVPLVIVPTSCSQLSFNEIARLIDDKVGLVICGNHAIRAAVTAMRRTFEHIIKDNGIAGVKRELYPCPISLHCRLMPLCESLKRSIYVRVAPCTYAYMKVGDHARIAPLGCEGDGHLCT